METCALANPSASPSLPNLRRRLPSSFIPSPLACRAISRAPPSAVSFSTPSDDGLQWQPLLRFDTDDLLSEASYLRRNCEDLDWESEARDLRARANLAFESYNKAIRMEGYGGQESNDKGDAGAWFSTGVAVAGMMLFQVGMSLEAFAADEQVEAASRAPSWLTPALLAFPIVSYAAFSVYRSQVNPYAKVSDWMFGVAAMVIVANLILISTIGVRLY